LAKRSEAVWQEVQHLVSAFRALINAYQRSAAPHAAEAVPSLQVGLAPHVAAIASGRDGRWPAGLRQGLRQGAREILHLLGGLPADERSKAFDDIVDAGGPWLRQLLFSDKGLDRILARGRIRSTDEYYQVMAFLDAPDPTHAHDDRRSRLEEFAEAYAVRPDAA
jgi:hypothetical protein